MQRLVRRPAGDAAGIIADMMAGLAAFRLNRGDVTYAVVSALRNWTFDLFCLVFSIKAAGAQTVVISGHPRAALTAVTDVQERATSVPRQGENCGHEQSLKGAPNGI